MQRAYGLLWWIITAIYSLLPVGFIVLVISALGASAASAIGVPLAAIIGAALIVVLAYLYARAQARPTSEQTITINRPLPLVFRFLADDFFANFPRWATQQPPIMAVLLSEQTLAGPLGLGTTGKVVQHAAKRDYEWHYLVTSYEQNQRISMKIESVPQGTIGISTLHFAPASTGTLVRIQTRNSFPIYWGLVSSTWLPYHQRAAQERAKTIKSVAEREIAVAETAS